MTPPELFAAYQPNRGPRDLTTSVAIRAATPADAPWLADLVVAREGGDPRDHRARFIREAGPNSPVGCPTGWYLAGVIVAMTARRRGVGRSLTQRRLAWIQARASEAFYFVNARNLASIDLHAAFGFQEVTRDFRVPGVTFSGGERILFRLAF